MAFDSGDINCRASIARGDADDNPHIVFRRSGGGRNKSTAYTRWTGVDWQAHSYPAAPHHEHHSDLSVTAAKTVRVLSAVVRPDGKRGVVQSDSDDGGVTWSDRDIVVSNYDWNISSLVTDAHPEGQFILLERTPGTASSRVYLWGEGGFVARAK
jgi:hypothetical protein